MYLTFEMIKDLLLDSYEPYNHDDVPNRTIYAFKCQNDVLKVVGVTDHTQYPDLEVVECNDAYIFPYFHQEERILKNKYQDDDVFKLSHVELNPESVYLIKDVSNGYSENLNKYMNTLMYTIYLDKIDGKKYTDISIDEFFSLNNCKEFIIRSLQKYNETFTDIDIRSTCMFEAISDVLYTIGGLEIYGMADEYNQSLSSKFLDKFIGALDLCIGLISYIANSKNLIEIPTVDLLNMFKNIDFVDIKCIKHFIYKDILSYIKFDTDKLSIYDAVSSLPYHNTAVIQDVYPEMPTFRMDDIFDDTDFLSIVLEELDLDSLKTTVKDILYSNSEIYVIPGDCSDNNYYFYNGVVADNPSSTEDEFVDSISNKKVYRQLTRVMRMRNHCNKLIKINNDDWVFLVLSQKSYFKDYEDDEEISMWLDDDEDEPVSRILAAVGQKDGQQYSIIRKIF